VAYRLSMGIAPANRENCKPGRKTFIGRPPDGREGFVSSRLSLTSATLKRYAYLPETSLN
jgi:hypothetical protein